MLSVRKFAKLVHSVKSWPSYLMDYANLKKGPIKYSLRNGVQFEARAGTFDRYAINEIWVYGAYFPKGFEINSGDTVLDLGAHIGTFAIYASKKVEHGKVISLEPNQDNFKLLRRNIFLNGCKNILALNKAVSSKSDKLKLFLNSENNGAHSFYKRNQEHFSEDKSYFVDSISLDKLFKKLNISKINFLKMDIEGAEYDVLLNSSHETLQKVDKIALEYHTIEGRNFKELINFLERNGFKVDETHKEQLMIYARRTYSRK